jgi:hypothetical protein
MASLSPHECLKVGILGPIGAIDRSDHRTAELDSTGQHLRGTDLFIEAQSPGVGRKRSGLSFERDRPRYRKCIHRWRHLPRITAIESSRAAWLLFPKAAGIPAVTGYELAQHLKVIIAEASAPSNGIVARMSAQLCSASP